MNSIISKLFRRRSTSASSRFYPDLRIENGCPACFFEFIESPNFVFADRHEGASETLASLAFIRGTAELSFLPKTNARPTAALQFSGFASRPYTFELPEVGERANYKQVVALPEYIHFRNLMKEAAKVSKSTTRGAMPGWGVALLLGLGLLSSILLFGGTGSKGASVSSAVPAVAAPPVVTPAPALSLGDQLNPTETAVLARVVAESGIEWGGAGGKPFVIFSDPNCPACRELEGKLASVEKSLTPVIVPVSFKPHSTEKVEGILCAKDASAAWKEAATSPTDGVPAPSCERGRKQAETNNAAFMALKFDRTPTIVTSSGKVAVGAKDFEGLMKWIKENSHE